jgi:hypothetical protein
MKKIKWRIEDEKSVHLLVFLDNNGIEEMKILKQMILRGCANFLMTHKGSQ